jgi:hypothetical protein
MAKWDRKAPFKDGALIRYVRSWSPAANGIEWRNADEPFEETLIYSGFCRGRSAAYLVFKNERGKVFPMHLADFDSTAAAMRAGIVKGRWCVSKRGQNFGVKLVEVAR